MISRRDFIKQAVFVTGALALPLSLFPAKEMSAFTITGGSCFDVGETVVLLGFDFGEDEDKTVYTVIEKKDGVLTLQS